MHRNSEMNDILSVGFTSIHNFPIDHPLNIENHGTKRKKQTHFYDRTWLGSRLVHISAELILSCRTFLHSCAHRFGLHLFASTMAIRVILSAIVRWRREGKQKLFNCTEQAENFWRFHQPFVWWCDHVICDQSDKYHWLCGIQHLSDTDRHGQERCQ